jgi:hypothetical protein
MTAPQTFDSHHRISVRKNLDIPSNAVFETRRGGTDRPGITQEVAT